MITRPNRGDLLAGLVLALLGLATVIYSSAHYVPGTMARMGPGFFPVMLGAALALVGTVIAVSALFRAAPAPRIEFRSLLVVTSSIVVFALLLNRTGLVVACLLATLLATRADPRLTWVSSLAIAAGVTILAALIFVGGLGMRLSLAPWN